MDRSAKSSHLKYMLWENSCLTQFTLGWNEGQGGENEYFTCTICQVLMKLDKIVFL